MTVHPHLGGLISRERQRETIARADRQRLLRGLAGKARRTREAGPRTREAGPGPRRAWRAALLSARLRLGQRAAR